MLELIIQLAIALGIWGGSTKGNIVVIDQNTGQTYSLGSTAGTGNNIQAPTSVFYLVKDINGNYMLIRK